MNSAGLLKIKAQVAKALLALVDSDVSAEVVAAADGATTEFSATLANANVIPEKVVVNATIGGSTVTLVDDGNGVLASTGNDSGTIDYETGDITLTFETAPDNLTNVTANYSYGDFSDFKIKKNKEHFGSRMVFECVNQDNNQIIQIEIELQELTRKGVSS